MSTSEIPDEIRRFLLQHIDSVAKLEALLLMRQDPQQEWDADLLSQRLYIKAQQAEAILTDLSQLGLCQQAHNRYHFEPAQTYLKDVSDRLAEVYSKQLIQVTNLIHSRSASPLQHFSDAFKLRKEES